MNDTTVRETSETTASSILEMHDPIVNHYISKIDIRVSKLTGRAVRALCGERYAVRSGSDGEVSEKTALTCPICQSIFEGLPA